MIMFIKDYLHSYGINSHLVFNDDKTKANLFAQIGPNVEGGVLLSGHTDVVPVEGQTWQTNPFRLTEKNNRLFGRGTCDMKAFNALILSIVPTLIKTKLKKPIQIGLSYDEEIGCLGAPRMIAGIQATLPKAAAVIVGDKTRRLSTEINSKSREWSKKNGSKTIYFENEKYDTFFYINTKKNFEKL